MAVMATGEVEAAAAASETEVQGVALEIGEAAAADSETELQEEASETEEAAEEAVSGTEAIGTVAHHATQAAEEVVVADSDDETHSHARIGIHSRAAVIAVIEAAAVVDAMNHSGHERL